MSMACSLCNKQADLESKDACMLVWLFEGDKLVRNYATLSKVAPTVDNHDQRMTTLLRVYLHF